MHGAIKKYGPENFTVEQIDVACTREELDAKEIYWIKYYNSMFPSGYNLTTGGKHCEISEEVKQKLSIKNKGKGPSALCIAKSVEARKGKKLSKEHIEKLRKYRIGEKNGMYGIRRYGADNPNAKKVYCIELDRIFPTITEASKFVNRNMTTLQTCLRGKSKTCGGYHWRFANNEGQ